MVLADTFFTFNRGTAAGNSTYIVMWILIMLV